MRLTAGDEAQLNTALRLHQAGALDAAAAIYDAILQAVPDHPEILRLRGVIAARFGDQENAAALIGRSLARAPGNATAHHSYAVVLRNLGRLAEALDQFDLAIANLPRFAEAYRDRGIALHAAGQSEAALADFDYALRLLPGHGPTHFNRGNALLTLGRLDAAWESFDAACLACPNDADAHYNAAVALVALRRHGLALTRVEQAIAVRPDMALAHNLRGNLLMHTHRPDEALASYNTAIGADRNLADAHNNKGSALRELGQHHPALASYADALALRPDFFEAQWNQGVALLLLGDTTLGWPAYERRLDVAPRRTTIGSDHRRWRGERSIAGCILFVQCEQGLGDTLQFVRYLPRLRAMGAEIVLSVQRPLQTLLARLLPFATIIDEDSVPDRFDLHCPLLSLPLAFSTGPDTIPRGLPTFNALPSLRAAWARRLGPARRPRIGIAWSGNPAHINDHNRTIPLAQWHNLLALRADWIAVQKDLRPADEEAAARLPQLAHFGEGLRDFEDTVALISELSLVITVDTSVAHLAAAMGKPVWLAVAVTPDWRWLLGRLDSPWYPTVRLFRQTRHGDWSGPLLEIKAQLRALIGDGTMPRRR